VDYTSVVYPTLITWMDVLGAGVSGRSLVDEAVLHNLAKLCTHGARWVKDENDGAKPQALKTDRPVGPQLLTQYTKLPKMVQVEIGRCRDRLARSQHMNASEDGEQEAISIFGLCGSDAVTAEFYRADVGVKDECKVMIDKHKGGVRAFLIYLTDEDKVDKAQFSVCMSVIGEMGKQDAFVVQVSI
jgi:hypothetical protein